MGKTRMTFLEAHCVFTHASARFLGLRPLSVVARHIYYACEQSAHASGAVSTYPAVYGINAIDVPPLIIKSLHSLSSLYFYLYFIIELLYHLKLRIYTWLDCFILFVIFIVVRYYDLLLLLSLLSFCLYLIIGLFWVWDY